MIYLDHNATTPLLPEVEEEMRRVARDGFGNPGSRHAAGRKARQILESARESIAAILGASRSEVVFTSGGTESINLALRGMTAGRRGTVLLPPGEHPATVETVKSLPHCQPTWLPINTQGLLIPNQFQSVAWEHVVCATCLLAHNETGVIQDLGFMREECESRQIPWHVDAVQAAGKLPLSFRELGCTAMSIGAHKFGGPRGIGALLIRQGVKLPSLMQGGHQEGGVRPGTEPVMLIAGMAEALEIWESRRLEWYQQLVTLRDRLQDGLLETIPFAVVNAGDAPRLPNTLSIAFPGCSAEALLVALDLAGVCCSLGSACASGSAQPSPILQAMQLPPNVVSSTLRLSLGVQNTEAEIDEAIRLISTAALRQTGQKTT